VTHANIHPSIDPTNAVPATSGPAITSIRNYDVGVFELDCSIPGVVPIQLDRAYVNNLDRLTDVGYGCDNINPGNGTQKQTVDFVAEGFSAGVTGMATADAEANATHSIGFFSNTVQTCPGDSGGPMFYRNSSGAWVVAGVNTFLWSTDSSDLFSFGARVSNVQKWIDSPAENMFSAGEVGTFINQGTGLCLDVSPGTSVAPKGQLIQSYCDGRKQPADTQFWVLRSLGSSFFQIVDSNSQLCVGVSGASTAAGALIGVFNCDTGIGTNANQAWHFVFHHSANSNDYYEIKNGKSGMCLAMDFNPHTLATTLRAVQEGCSSSGTPFSPSEGYVFSR
jgi:hypothetical protein